MGNRRKIKIKPKNTKSSNRNFNQQKKSGVSNPPKGRYGSNEKNQRTNTYVARAPYNFVPLNMSVIDADPLPDHNKYHSDRFTGYVDCELETLTPLYIRGCLTEDEVKGGIKAKEKSDFFSPAAQVRIPGSSLRGMLRNLVEIVSWSKFGFFDNKNLYYRSFDRSSASGEYKANMNPDQAGSSAYKMSAGYLVKDRFKYKIYPAEKFEKIDEKDAKNLIRDIGQKYTVFKYYTLKDGKSIIVSGKMPRKKDWIISKIDKKSKNVIEILELDIRNYEMDENRKAPNLLEKCKTDPEVPCFYVIWVDAEGNNRVSFGHTALFRIAYKKSIGEHIPPIHHEQNKIDFAHAIFGMTADENEDSFAGRVFFEDASLIESTVNPFMEEATPKILLGPKPTSFQLYLEQNTINAKKLKHYNSETWIRGSKFYWHKSGKNWKNDDINNSNENVKTKIKPVKPNTKFKFHIRFENLSRNELGALLFALKLPEGCAHKIGMGKPLGLGTVKISSTLHVSDRKKRYLTLFDEIGWSLPETETKDHEIIAAFENHILKNMNNEDKRNALNLWDTYRLKQLKLLLNIKIGVQLEEKGTTEYMGIKDFRHRNVLPYPEQVANSSK